MTCKHEYHGMTYCHKCGAAYEAPKPNPIDEAILTPQEIADIYKEIESEILTTASMSRGPANNQLFGDMQLTRSVYAQHAKTIVVMREVVKGLNECPYNDFTPSFYQGWAMALEAALKLLGGE